MSDWERKCVHLKTAEAIMFHIRFLSQFIYSAFVWQHLLERYTLQHLVNGPKQTKSWQRWKITHSTTLSISRYQQFKENSMTIDLPKRKLQYVWLRKKMCSLEDSRSNHVPHSLRVTIHLLSICMTTPARANIVNQPVSSVQGEDVRARRSQWKLYTLQRSTNDTTTTAVITLHHLDWLQLTSSTLRRTTTLNPESPPPYQHQNAVDIEA